VPGVDDRLTRELERAARPASPVGTFERVDRLRARRARSRRIGSAALVVIVLAGTLGSIAFLRNVFRESSPALAGDEPMNGAIVFARIRDGRQHLWVRGTDGSDHQLTQNIGPASDETYPSVSPDGKFVAFVSSTSDGSVSIYATPIGGGGPVTRLTDGTQPSWSPDGARIAFAGSRDGNPGIYVMAQDGTGVRPVVINLYGAAEPSWTPDGRRIVFSASAGEGTDVEGEPFQLDLYSVAPDGSDLIQLTNTPDAGEIGAQFSPDGSSIVVAKEATSANNTTSTLVMLDADGSHPRTLLPSPLIDSAPTWSPDGELLAFERFNGGHSTIFTVRPDGSGLSRIGSGSAPAWQPVFETVSVTPSPTPVPGQSDAAQDLGFAFPVCNVHSIQADFDGDGVTDTSYVATKMSDAPACPQADQADNVLGVDLDGDGKVDADGGPISCQLDCLPWVAVDLNADGAAELFVAQLVSPIVGLTPYQLVDGGGGLALVPIAFAPPGDPGNDLSPGKPVMLYVGGDEGFAARLECDPTEAGAVLTALTGNLDSIERPTTWTVRSTEFRIEGGRHDPERPPSQAGWFEVSDTSVAHQPAGDQGPFGSVVDPQLCGVPFPDIGVFPPAN
jgi:hypothetical protein